MGQRELTLLPTWHKFSQSQSVRPHCQWLWTLFSLQIGQPEWKVGNCLENLFCTYLAIAILSLQIPCKGSTWRKNDAPYHTWENPKAKHKVDEWGYTFLAWLDGLLPSMTSTANTRTPVHLIIQQNKVKKLKGRLTWCGIWCRQHCPTLQKSGRGEVQRKVNMMPQLGFYLQSGTYNSSVSSKCRLWHHYYFFERKVSLRWLL